MDLTKSSMHIWTEYADSIIKSPAKKALLRQALEARDRAIEAGKILKAEGIIFVTGKTKMPHCHPATKIEKESWSIVLKIFQTLKLQYDSTWSGDIYDNS